jgi:hypothetical protein
MNWRERRKRERTAARFAQDLVDAIGIDSPPVDPLGVASREKLLLVTKGADFRQAFDGQLEYHPNAKRFILFFNTAYDRTSEHASRTRFSIAHELGHYYLDHHRAYLLRGGRSHGSRAEFQVDAMVERDADAFAAGLLLPERFLARHVAHQELRFERLVELATDVFATSVLSLAWRAVDLSHLPCALIGVREGVVAWRVHSESLTDAGCWPSEWRELRSASALKAWAMFHARQQADPEAESSAAAWFSTYGIDHLNDILVSEEYFAVPAMNTLLVLITIDQADLG